MFFLYPLCFSVIHDCWIAFLFKPVHLVFLPVQLWLWTSPRANQASYFRAFALSIPFNTYIFFMNFARVMGYPRSDGIAGERQGSEWRRGWPWLSRFLPCLFGEFLFNATPKELSADLWPYESSPNGEGVHHLGPFRCCSCNNCLLAAGSSPCVLGRAPRVVKYNEWIGKYSD